MLMQIDVLEYLCDNSKFTNIDPVEFPPNFVSFKNDLENLTENILMQTFFFFPVRRIVQFRGPRPLW